MTNREYDKQIIWQTERLSNREYGKQRDWQTENMTSREHDKQKNWQTENQHIETLTNRKPTDGAIFWLELSKTVKIAMTNEH